MQTCCFTIHRGCLPPQQEDLMVLKAAGLAPVYQSAKDEARTCQQEMGPRHRRRRRHRGPGGPRAGNRGPLRSYRHGEQYCRAVARGEAEAIIPCWALRDRDVSIGRAQGPWAALS